MKHFFKQYRIIKIRHTKPWQIQKRHNLFWWKDLDMHFSTFEEAKTAALDFKLLSNQQKK